MNKLSLQELMHEIEFSTPDELAYLLSRYCGPHNLLLREKKYSYDACRQITRLVKEEITYRAFEEIILSDN